MYKCLINGLGCGSVALISLKVFIGLLGREPTSGFAVFIWWVWFISAEARMFEK
jgi:hypothetical protein|tara:strand:- start:962 stop:1123 length:162 start_codon:yes stop_codon:yes gene_type:complete